MRLLSLALSMIFAFTAAPALAQPAVPSRAPAVPAVPSKPAQDFNQAETNLAARMKTAEATYAAEAAKAETEFADAIWKALSDFRAADPALYVKWLDAEKSPDDSRVRALQASPTYAKYQNAVNEAYRNVNAAASQAKANLEAARAPGTAAASR
jgi:hypothetical protein